MVGEKGSLLCRARFRRNCSLFNSIITGCRQLWTGMSTAILYCLRKSVCMMMTRCDCFVDDKRNERYHREREQLKSIHDLLVVPVLWSTVRTK
jgi:DNA relaxase NicK